MNISFHLHKINVDIHKTNFYRRKFEYFFFNKILRKKNLVSLLTIDPLLYEHTRNYNSKKIDYLPDPVSFNDTPTSKEEARRAIGIYQKLPIVLVYGSITVRKGVLDLLEAFCSSSIRSKYLILIAGKIDKPLINPIAEFSENHKNIIVHNKYINKNDEHYYFKASDINWCGYKNFDKISAVYVQGSLYGLPAISSNNGLIGYFTRKNENGICINSTTKESISFVLHQLRKQTLYEKMAINGRHFAAAHIEEKSLANLNKHILKIIKNN
jgi:glycosyltransferase involved in cell wall biosynthesis